MPHKVQGSLRVHCLQHRISRTLDSWARGSHVQSRSRGQQEIFPSHELGKKEQGRERNLREEEVLSFFKMECNWKQPQPRSGSRIIESWQNVLVYLCPERPPSNTHSVVQHRRGLMLLQGIYEDFCFEDSFLGNRVKTCTDGLSFISAGASSDSQTASVLRLSPKSSKLFKGLHGVASFEDSAGRGLSRRSSVQSAPQRSQPVLS